MIANGNWSDNINIYRDKELLLEGIIKLMKQLAGNAESGTEH